MPGIVLVGLGVGGPEQLGVAARELLADAAELWLRTRNHPALVGTNARTVVNSFDELLERWDPSVDAAEVIAAKVLELGRRPQGVVYAVPGHPLIARLHLCRDHWSCRRAKAWT